MFKKLLSNLPFNPSLIHQISFYASRMRKEASVRRLGVVFLVLALVVQAFAVMSPAQASVTGSTNDILFGGFTSQSEAVSKCRSNVQSFATILNYYQVSCDHLASAATISTYVKSTDYSGNLDSLGRNPQPAFNPKNHKPSNQYTVNIPGLSTLYMKNLWYWDTYSSSTYKVLRTTNASGATIMIMYSCGNLITTTPYTPPPPPLPPPPVIPPSVSCSNLSMNVADNSRIRLGSHVLVRGQAAGQNLPAGQKVDMYYSFMNTDSGQVVDTDQSLGVGFQDSIANDPSSKDFSSNSSGHFAVLLSVKYAGMTVTGSASGNCAKHLTVQKACEGVLDTEDLERCLTIHKTARNLTQNIADANNTTAHASDSIVYTLSVKNTGKVTVPQFVIEENMNDVLEYATITDFHGGQLDTDNHMFWAPVDIRKDQVVERQITIKVKDPIPKTPTSVSDPSSFDLKMVNVYGNSVVINLPGPPNKKIETVSGSLPNTGPGTSLMIGFGITTVAAYFFARSRLLVTELGIVRHDIGSSGGPE